MYSEEVEEEELGEEEEELDEEQEASATVRHTRKKRAKPEPPMSAEEAWATADAEGLKGSSWCARPTPSPDLSTCRGR